MTASQDAELQQFLQRCRERCEHTMRRRLAQLPAMPARLIEAMQYSTLLGGKRIRPCLVYASAHALGATAPQADTAAAAVEMMHCYSLIHDDLPAMDNDDLRRGQPTTHRAFDEATAILAGDALQSLAIEMLSEQGDLPAGLIVQMIHTLVAASGCSGMIAGQGIDMAAVGQQLTLDALANMHALKTGALITASVELGALSAHCTEPGMLEALRRYSRCIGLAFQVQDDILDVVSDTTTLGKTQGADAARNKPTYVSLLGLNGAREKAAQLVVDAEAALTPINGDTRYLAAIARYITERQH